MSWPADHLSPFVGAAINEQMRNLYSAGAPVHLSGNLTVTLANGQRSRINVDQPFPGMPPSLAPFGQPSSSYFSQMLINAGAYDPMTQLPGYPTDIYNRLQTQLRQQLSGRPRTDSVGALASVHAPELNRRSPARTLTLADSMNSGQDSGVLDLSMRSLDLSGSMTVKEESESPTSPAANIKKRNVMEIADRLRKNQRLESVIAPLQSTPKNTARNTRPYWSPGQRIEEQTKNDELNEFRKAAGLPPLIGHHGSFRGRPVSEESDLGLSSPKIYTRQIQGLISPPKDANNGNDAMDRGSDRGSDRSSHTSSPVFPSREAVLLGMASTAQMPSAHDEQSQMPLSSKNVSPSAFIPFNFGLSDGRFSFSGGNENAVFRMGAPSSVSSLNLVQDDAGSGALSDTNNNTKKGKGRRKSRAKAEPKPPKPVKVQPLKNYKFTCETCGKKFLYKSKWKEHLPSHSHVKQFKCLNPGLIRVGDKWERCDKVHQRAYKYPYDLRVHLEHHEGIPIKSGKCRLCFIDFHASKDLKRHFYHNHRDLWGEICAKVEVWERKSFEIIPKKYTATRRKTYHDKAKEGSKIPKTPVPYSPTAEEAALDFSPPS